MFVAPASRAVVSDQWAVGSFLMRRRVGRVSQKPPQGRACFSETAADCSIDIPVCAHMLSPGSPERLLGFDCIMGLRGCSVGVL